MEPFLPFLYRQVRVRLKSLVEKHKTSPKVLDVGGRKSPYTIGVPADITIIDLPKVSEVQKKLNLGINNGIIEQVRKRRSNIKNIVFGDMTCSDLPDQSFDYDVAVEVLEHVEKTNCSSKKFREY